MDGLVTRDELEESSVLHSLTNHEMATINDYPSLMNARVVHTSIDHDNKKKNNIYTFNALTRVISQPSQMMMSLGKKMGG